MPFDIQGARQEGYSDKEITAFFSQSVPDFDVGGALKEGYSLDEISSFLEQPRVDTTTLTKPSLFEIGKMTLPILAKERFETAKRIATTPAIPVKRLGAEALEVTGLKEPFRETFPSAFGVAKGGAEIAESFTTPLNAALIGGTIVLPVTGIAGKLIAAGFAADIASQIPAQYKEYNEAVKSGNKEEIGRLGAHIVGSGTLSALVAKGIRPKPVSIKEIGKERFEEGLKAEKEAGIREAITEEEAGRIPLERRLPAPEERIAPPVSEIKERGLPILQPPRPDLLQLPAPEKPIVTPLSLIHI